MRMVITGLLVVFFLGSWAVADDFPAVIAPDKGLIVRAATLEPFGDDRPGKIAIETVNPATGETESIWTGLAPTNEVLVSPDSSSISFIEPVRYVDGKMEYKSTLRVIGFDGIERHTVPGVRRYRWSPDSQSIVYLTGPYAENGQGFKSAGTYIYDLASKTSKQIAPWGYEAMWAPFDGAIYIWYSGAEGKDVLRFDPATGALTDTPYRDIFFSPDGVYFYRPSREGTGFELRLTETNENVITRWPFLAIRYERIYPRGWIDDTTLVIPRSSGDYVFNLNEGVPRQAYGEVIGYTADKKAVYAVTKDGITTQPLAEMTVVPVHGLDTASRDFPLVPRRAPMEEADAVLAKLHADAAAYDRAALVEKLADLSMRCPEGHAFQGHRIPRYNDERLNAFLTEQFLHEIDMDRELRPQGLDPGSLDPGNAGEIYQDYMDVLGDMAYAVLDPAMYDRVLTGGPYSDARLLYLAAVNPETVLTLLLECEPGADTSEHAEAIHVMAHPENKLSLATVEAGFTLLARIAELHPDLAAAHGEQIDAFIDAFAKHYEQTYPAPYRPEPVQSPALDTRVKRLAMDALAAMGGAHRIYKIWGIAEDTAAFYAGNTAAAEQRDELVIHAVDLIDDLLNPKRPR